MIQNTKTFTTKKGETFTRHLYNVDVDFTPEQKCVIFTHGKTDYNLWFTNKSKKLCLVTDAEKDANNNIFLTVVINAKADRQYSTKLTLDRFLYLVEIGEFRISSKKFKNTYLKPFEESKLFANLEA